MSLNITTSRKYDLCTRKPFGMGPSQTQFRVILALVNNSPRRPTSDGEQEVGGIIASDSKGPRRSYSDVAASRPPSPTMCMVDETPIPPGRNPSLNREIDDEHASTAAPVPVESPIMDTSESDEDERPWTTVKHRRSSKINKKLNNSIDITQNLTAEVQSAVQQGEQALTVAQKEQILRRHTKVRNPHHERSESRGEGASNPKGKQIDPREWGNVQLSESEVDVQAQQAALKSYKITATKNPKERREASHPRGTSKSHGNHHKNDLPAVSRPIAQVPAKSYIGVALKNIGRRSHMRELSDDSSSGSSSPQSESSKSSDSSSSSDSGSDSSSDESDEKTHRQASKRPIAQGHSSKKKKHNKKKSRHSGHSKAIKPNEYDGTPDAHAYYRFIKESATYIEDSGISRKRQCFALSYYLTDKAYDFYQQKVSLTEEKWTLEEFYTELFNFCFPINYWTQM